MSEVNTPTTITSYISTKSTRILIYLHFHQNLTSNKIITILTGVSWYATMILICISLMISNVEHFYTYPWAICTSWDKCLFKSFSHFKSNYLLFLLLLLLSFKSFLYTLDITPLSHVSTWLTNIFSHSVNYLFTLLIVSFGV